jgi:hypothetical protein
MGGVIITDFDDDVVHDSHPDRAVAQGLDDRQDKRQGDQQAATVSKMLPRTRKTTIRMAMMTYLDTWSPEMKIDQHVRGVGHGHEIAHDVRADDDGIDHAELRAVPAREFQNSLPDSFLRPSEKQEGDDRAPRRRPRSR